MPTLAVPTAPEFLISTSAMTASPFALRFRDSHSPPAVRRTPVVVRKAFP